MANISLRDAEITGINHDQENKELLMYAHLQSGEKCQLVFQAVAWWELCSFGVENVLSVIDAFDANSLTKDVIDEHDIGNQHIDMVKSGPNTLFVLHASAGLSGWVMAQNMIVRAAGKK